MPYFQQVGLDYLEKKYQTAPAADEPIKIQARYGN